jgi:hypothetical protein
MPFRKYILTGLQLAGAILSFHAASPFLLAQAKWEKLATFPEPAEEILGAAAGGKMYVFAGLIPFWKPKGLVYEYNPASNQWTKKKPKSNIIEVEFEAPAAKGDEIAGRLTGKLRANSPTGCGPCSSRSRIARRVGSPKASSCCACW